MPYTCERCQWQCLSADELQAHVTTMCAVSTVQVNLLDSSKRLVDMDIEQVSTNNDQIVSGTNSDSACFNNGSIDDDVELGKNDENNDTDSTCITGTGSATSGKRRRPQSRKMKTRTRTKTVQESRTRKTKNSLLMTHHDADSFVTTADDNDLNFLPDNDELFPPKISQHFTCHVEYTCKFCSQVFYSLKDCRRHLEMCSPKVEEIVNPEVDYGASKRKAKRAKSLARLEERKAMYNLAIGVDGDKFFCKICDKVFDCESKVERHLDGSGPEHAPSKLLCEFCGTEFKGAGRKNKYEIHMRIHTGEKPYLCDECGSSFRLQKNLQKHRRSIHLREYPFSCKVCQRGFPTSWNLRRHERTHSDDRPQRLKQCKPAQAVKPLVQTGLVESAPVNIDRSNSMDMSQVMEPLRLPPPHPSYFAVHPSNALTLVARSENDLRPTFSVNHF